MNKGSIFLCCLMASFNVFSFHEVTEVLPSGKILICKDYGQVRKGNIVEIFSAKTPGSRMEKGLIKTGELTLPEIGQSIKLTSFVFKSEGRLRHISKSDEIGTAVVADVSLEGEDRVVTQVSSARMKNVSTKITKISKEEALKIKEDCIVALPEKGLVLKGRASVNW